ncbi:hypothetical protein TrispH2_010188 [Trichoplax sp. H2]|nr:hypothetical protein TrispH2_010188 [Trichoplax sp. H2]|eukprot:RDD38963.1 hypothetical protein TrispH2_010188 [Trichoplax sp. H2]
MAPILIVIHRLQNCLAVIIAEKSQIEMDFKESHQNLAYPNISMARLQYLCKGEASLHEMRVLA